MINSIPNFTTKDSQGTPISSDSLKGKPCVIFFYPKNFTYGCAAEVCSFRDGYQDFEEIGAKVIGISQDDNASHDEFINKHELPFQLISDGDNSLRKLFGVKGDLLGLIPGRETFVFDSAGKLIRHFKSQSKVKQHVNEAIEAIKKVEGQE